jgi:protein-disulfide isomerase
MKRLLFALILAAFSFSVAQAENRVQVPLGDSPTLGPADAPVTMIEFIDFQ